MWTKFKPSPPSVTRKVQFYFQFLSSCNFIRETAEIRETAKQQEAKSLFNFKKTYYNLIYFTQLQNLQLELVVNYQDVQIPGMAQKVDKMVNLHQNQLPSISQFLKTQPLDLPASGEENI